MIDIELKGGKELERAFEAISFKTSRTLIGNATRSGAALFRKFARTYVPKDSGRLRKAMVHKRTIRRPDVIQYSVGFGSRAYYGNPLEVGGFYKVRGGGVRYQPAHPMLRRALIKDKGAVFDKITDMLWKGIKREAVKRARKF